MKTCFDYDRISYAETWLVINIVRGNSCLRLWFSIESVEVTHASDSEPF